MRRSLTVLIYAIFTMSGAVALIYEIAWSRLFVLIIGSTTAALTTVLVAFMGGLAVGGALGGRLVRREAYRARPRRLLLAYAVIEVGIGVTALAAPHLIDGATPLLQWAYRAGGETAAGVLAIRFVICALVLLLPTSLMGMTLPILSEAVVSWRHALAGEHTPGAFLGRGVGGLYAVNAGGAVMGSLAAGFLIVPSLGLAGTQYLAAACNVFLAGVVWVLCRRVTEAPAPAAAEAPEDEACSGAGGAARPAPGTRAAALLGIAISGACAMVLQIAWTRAFAMYLGSSTYSFTLIVASFIVGLSVGSAVLAPYVDRWAQKGVEQAAYYALAISMLLTGAVAVGTVMFLGDAAPAFFRIVAAYQHTYALLLAVEGAIVLATLILPTMCLGASFACAVGAYGAGRARAPHEEALDDEDAGRTASRVYVANTAGAICGSIVVGFIALDLWGVRASLLGAAAVVGVSGAALTLVPFRRSGRIAVLGLMSGAAVIGLVRVNPAWDPRLVTSGPFLYDLPHGVAPADIAHFLRSSRLIRYYREGANISVAVKQSLSGELALTVNGKVDASSVGDLRTQTMSAHAPVLAHPRPRDVRTALVVGLGSGLTLESLTHYPFERIDVVELSHAVVEAAPYFTDALDDPRVQVILGDGRTHLQYTDRRYDIVTIEPSNPWIAGTGNLFSAEFYGFVRRTLSDNGVVCAWIQAYRLDPDLMRRVVRTFQHSFPHTFIWEPAIGADYLIVGSARPLSLPPDRLREILAMPAVSQDLGRIAVRTPLDIRALRILDTEGVRAYAGDGPLIEDNWQSLEFEAPKSLYRDTGAAAVHALEAHRTNALAAGDLSIRSLTSGDRAILMRQARARTKLIAAVDALVHNNTTGFIRHLEAARAYAPANQQVVSLGVENFPRILGSPVAPAGVVRTFESLVRGFPDPYEYLLVVGAHYAERGMYDDARRVAEEAHTLRPAPVWAPYQLALTEFSAGFVGKADEYINEALAKPPDFAMKWVIKSQITRSRGKVREAQAAISEALERDPLLADVQVEHGFVELQSGNHDAAAEAFERALEQHPGSVTSYIGLAQTYMLMGKPLRARRAAEQALAIQPNHPGAQYLLSQIRAAP